MSSHSTTCFRLVDVEDPELLAEMFQTVVHIIKAQRFDQSNYKVITKGGSYQSNQHLHIHLVSGKPLNPESPAAKGELAVS
jgi:diadenosine tetraphosphate (Ap4A) HIT family hydrolase